MIKISVIIPVYNEEKYLPECLNSVLAQTLKEIEIICINDGSTDGSYDILMDYSKKYANVIVLHQENQGSGLARNKGIECAKGKYICFMDPDDYYAQNCALQKLYMNAEENCVLVCGGNLLSIWENGKIQKESHWFSENHIISFEEDGDFFHYTTYIFNLKFIHRYRITFPPYRRFQDPVFLLKVMVHAQEFLGIDEPVYIYRQLEKELNWDVNTVADVLRGIRDCFRICKEHNLLRAYDKYLKNMLNNYLHILYPYAIQGELWELINEVNAISQEWLGESSEIFQDMESLKTYIDILKEKRNQMISICRKAEEVIIYGAGEAGQFFLKNFGKECRHIVGFAVSNRKSGQDFVAGYEVKEISEYSRNALVIVAVGKKNAIEILQNLERMQFENICYIEYGALRFLEDISGK